MSCWSASSTIRLGRTNRFHLQCNCEMSVSLPHCSWNTIAQILLLTKMVSFQTECNYRVNRHFETLKALQKGKQLLRYFHHETSSAWRDCPFNVQCAMTSNLLPWLPETKLGWFGRSNDYSASARWIWAGRNQKLALSFLKNVINVWRLDAWKLKFNF